MRDGLWPRPLPFPGMTIEIGDEIIVRDSRGAVSKGFFMGFASGWISLATQCGGEIDRVISIKRVAEIIKTGKRCEPREGETDAADRANEANPDAQGKSSDNGAGR